MPQSSADDGTFLACCFQRAASEALLKPAAAPERGGMLLHVKFHELLCSILVCRFRGSFAASRSRGQEYTEGYGRRDERRFDNLDDISIRLDRQRLGCYVLAASVLSLGMTGPRSGRVPLGQDREIAELTERVIRSKKEVPPSTVPREH